ncbi:MAG: hypothetical protein NXI24_18125 [bacterium]|nr:hypothetical protein [bacterium]
MSGGSEQGRSGAWHDPYDGLFGESEPRFTLLERRFLMLTWFAGELADGDLTGAIETSGEEIDADVEGALERFDALEERILALLETRLDVPDLPEFPTRPDELREIRNRLRTLLCVAYFQEDPEGSRQTLALAGQILDGLPHSYEKTVEVADADLTVREELLLEVVADESQQE